MAMNPAYQHTQRGPWYWVLLTFAAFTISLAAVTAGQAPMQATVVMTAVGILLAALSFSFRYLTVEVDSEQVELRFGPVPLFRSRVRLEDIESVVTAKSSILDGWGIHWVPGRGWTFNMWGFDCVELRTHRGRIRIGTDEPEKLAEAIRSLVAERQNSGERSR